MGGSPAFRLPGRLRRGSVTIRRGGPPCPPTAGPAQSTTRTILDDGRATNDSSIRV
jgi:hypothetical protein